MNVPARLGLYAGGLALVFGASFGVAALVAPDAPSAASEAVADDHGAGEEHGSAGPQGGSDTHGGSSDPGSSDAATTVGVKGVTASEQGYTLIAVDAPAAVGDAGTLSFAITGPAGDPVTDYEVTHERDLHLIVVRTDGAEFRHVHPTLQADGTWSIPWTWDAAGGYRIYADFVPADLGEGLTLTSSVLVGGDVESGAGPTVTETTTAGPYEVTMSGALTAGAESSVTFSVTRDGEPVALEPYLGANGHLVALRTGDLAYLHVHPAHDDTAGGGDADSAEGHDDSDAHTADGGHAESSVSFLAEVPTAGTYLLYVDFQVDGIVRTAAFEVTAS
jgi:hypothetical protein